MNPNHKKLIKRFSLGDKEAEACLTQVYYDTPIDERRDLLIEMMKRSGFWGKQIKSVLLEQLDIEDAARARIKEEVEDYVAAKAEGLRGEDAGGTDAEDGGGRGAE